MRVELLKKRPRKLPYLFTHMGTEQKISVFEAGNELSQDIKSVSFLILDFLTFKTLKKKKKKKKFCCL
jgi:hypothetical protein